MKKTSICTAINLIVLALVWAGLVLGVHLLMDAELEWWANGLTIVGALIASGYLVQYVLSGFINRWVMKRDIGQRSKNSSA